MDRNKEGKMTRLDYITFQQEIWDIIRGFFDSDENKLASFEKMKKEYFDPTNH